MMFGRGPGGSEGRGFDSITAFNGPGRLRPGTATGTISQSSGPACLTNHCCSLFSCPLSRAQHAFASWYVIAFSLERVNSWRSHSPPPARSTPGVTCGRQRAPTRSTRCACARLSRLGASVIGAGLALANVAVRALALDSKMRDELIRRFRSGRSSPTFAVFSEERADLTRWASTKRFRRAASRSDSATG